MISGIYTITNTINGKMYIGQSKDMQGRWIEHIHSLNGKYHENSKLQRAWNKYGKDNFKFEVLVECSKEHMHSEEHYWILLLDVRNDKYGYNIRPTNPYGKPKASEESRKRMSEAQKLVWKDNFERKRKLSELKKGNTYGKGKIITPENRIKINEGKKNAYYSSEARKGMGHMRGKTLSIETIQKMKETRNIRYPKKIKIKKRDTEGYINPLKGRARPIELKEQLRRMFAKRIICYNENGTLYKIYNSVYDTVKEAEQKVSGVQLRRVIKSGKLYRNKYWKYENTNNESAQ